MPESFPQSECPALRRRLWIGGLGVALFFIAGWATNPFLSSGRGVTLSVMWPDFQFAYVAGNTVREGRVEHLYEPATMKGEEFTVWQKAGNADWEPHPAPWMYPPFFVLVFAGLSVFPYGLALAIWLVTSALLLTASVVLLARMLPSGTAWRTWGLVPLLVCASMPCMQAFHHAQNTFVSLFLLTTTVFLARRGDAFAAGAVCGLLFFKPQVGALVAALVVFICGHRALMGLLATGVVLAVVSESMLPGTLWTFATRMPLDAKAMLETDATAWERHVTLKGFWRLFFQGHTPGPDAPAVKLMWALSWTVLAALVGHAMWRGWRRPRSPRQTDRLLAAALAALPLLTPYFGDYDLLVLAAPAVMFAGDVMRRAVLTRLDRWLISSWSALYLWLMVNPGFMAPTGVNPTVILMSGVAALMIRHSTARQGEDSLPEHAADCDRSSSSESSPRTEIRGLIAANHTVRVR
ncbi:MAG: glycosyltransferase family 87 protein [Tepidisphaeraceae bacterium]